MRDIVHHALDLAIPQFRLDLNHGIHGLKHWVRVWRNAKELCEVEDLDPTVPCFFAFLHDSQRFDDSRDDQHGHRAVQWLEQLYVQRKICIKANDFHLLCRAIDGHSLGLTEADPIVQVCWDADRLDLGRCLTRPDPRYLCTEHGQSEEMIQSAVQRSLRGVHHEVLEGLDSWVRDSLLNGVREDVR